MKSTLKQSIAALSIGALACGVVSCSGGDMSSNGGSPDATEQMVPRPDLYPTPLASEEMLLNESIDDVNAGYVFVHDLNFGSLISGRVIVFDALAENRNFKGQISAGQFAAFGHAPSRNELYVAETFYSRGVRGDRTDLLAIYDANSLDIEHEIILPNNNRGLNVPLKGNMKISQDESFAFIYSFTPSSGVIVVDLNRRRVVNEISIPGCSMIYPFRERGFALHCGDGAMVAYDLDRRGQVVSEHSTEEFHDIDNHPMFLTGARVGDMMYWPTFTGQLVSADFSTSPPTPTDSWNFVGDTGYLPSGWQLITAAPTGMLYVIMLADAQPGFHKLGGDEVWEIDPIAKKVVRKIKLNSWAFSIEALKTQEPILIVAAPTEVNFSIDVYDLNTEKPIRSIGGFLANTFALLHASEIDQ